MEKYYCVKMIMNLDISVLPYQENSMKGHDATKFMKIATDIGTILQQFDIQLAIDWITMIEKYNLFRRYIIKCASYGQDEAERNCKKALKLYKSWEYLLYVCTINLNNQLEFMCCVYKEN